jgi:hypothetical protein
MSNNSFHFSNYQSWFKKYVIGTAVVFFFLNASFVFAHDIIVKRNSNLRQEPTSASAILDHFEPGDELILIQLEKQNGYYQAMSRDTIGWIWARNVRVIQEYDRGQWKHWIDEDRDGQKTRDEVLIAESEIPVTFVSLDSKKVVAGRWTDPYTGELFTDPKDLDIDHMVPLKNAHQTGGWLWTLVRRKKFANDLNHPEHLIAVKASANRSKGFRGPDKWLPTNEAFHCEYVNYWEAIKNRWNLTITEAEAAAIFAVRARCPQD